LEGKQVAMLPQAFNTQSPPFIAVPALLALWFLKCDVTLSSYSGATSQSTAGCRAENTW